MEQETTIFYDGHDLTVVHEGRFSIDEMYIHHIYDKHGIDMYDHYESEDDLYIIMEEVYNKLQDDFLNNLY